MNTPTERLLAKLPEPYDINIERGLLSGIAVRADAFDIEEVASIERGDFFLPAHGVIFSTLQSMWRAGEPTDDLLVLTRRLKETTLGAGNASGVEILSEILSTKSNAAHVATYSRSIKELAVRRKMIAFGLRLTEKATSGSIAIKDVAAEIERMGQSAVSSDFEVMTSADLDDGEYDLKYLIEGVLVKDQPCMIGGPKKSLKTNISIDLTLALAGGGCFLGRFPVPRPVKVGLMSGESGGATIQETARRIAAKTGIPLRQYKKAFWSFDIPQLGDPSHRARLKRFVAKNKLEVLVIDPTYLAMGGAADDAKNLFAMGALLAPLNDLGCSVILVHHFKKTVLNQYEPASMEDLAFAGFQEFARQWILLNRRSPYDPDRGGEHELWMSSGGSAGHGGLWGLDIKEGTRDTPSGRFWDVNILTAAEANEQRDEATEHAGASEKLRKANATKAVHRDAVLNVLENYPNGETQSFIREAAMVRPAVVKVVIDDLVREGKVEACTVKKNNRNEPAWRLTPRRFTGSPGALGDAVDLPGDGGSPAFPVREVVTPPAPPPETTTELDFEGTTTNTLLETNREGCAVKDKPRFEIVFEAGKHHGDDDDVRRIRRLLKYALRALGLKCITCRRTDRTDAMPKMQDVGVVAILGGQLAMYAMQST